MEFALSEDQKLLQDSVKAFLDAEAPLDRIRAYAAGDASIAGTLSSGLYDLGAAQVLVPEAQGGLGLGLLDAALIQEALGGSVSAGNFLSTAMAIVGIAHGGTPAQKDEWLGRIAAGDARFGVAVNEAVSVRSGPGVTGEGGTLSGMSLFAQDTADATHILVADGNGGLHVVDAGAPGLSRRPLTTIDRTRDFAELEFAATPAVALTGENRVGLGAYHIIQCGRLLVAADTLGACQAMIDKAVAYAKDRKQFNRVIGSFQAVKHMCAEMAAQLEPARALVWHAAHARDQDDPEAAVMINLAKSHLAEIGTFIARTSTEVHGGMGMTDLLGLHFWFKRIGVNRQLLGSPERVREDAARLQGWV